MMSFQNHIEYVFTEIILRSVFYNVLACKTLQIHRNVCPKIYNYIYNYNMYFRLCKEKCPCNTVSSVGRTPGEGSNGRESRLHGSLKD